MSLTFLMGVATGILITVITAVIVLGLIVADLMRMRW